MTGGRPGRPNPAFDPAAAWAVAGGRLLTDLREVTDDPAALDRPGHWVLVATFEGRLVAARFATAAPMPGPSAIRDLIQVRWPGLPPDAGAWRSSLSRSQFVSAVGEIRDLIAAGEVYQVNLCRVLDRPWPARLPAGEGLAALAVALGEGNPAPYSAAVHLPDHGIAVASASPELFLERRGREVCSGPIKGTAATPDGLTGKDRAENVMIVDLVRNDLARVCEPGSVEVPALLEVEQHPGLVHLVSRVRGRLRPGVGWAGLLAATMPPGSVSGAPKYAALRIIGRLEPEPRGAYCGAIGWIDTGDEDGPAGREAGESRGRLAVGIRTFEVADGMLRLGTGAGITWGSVADAEWEETELKTRRLLQAVGG